jgi:hypothetical protein
LLVKAIINSISSFVFFEIGVSAEEPVPEGKSHSEIHVTTPVVMVHVNPGDSPEVLEGRLPVVSEVVHLFEAAVANNLSRKERACVVGRQYPTHWHDHEWVQNQPQGNPREHRSSVVLRVSVVDSIQYEVARDCILIVGHPVPFTMENETMERILKEGPEHHTSHESQE